MTTTTVRIRRIALLSGASLALAGVAFTPQARATGAPAPNPTGQVISPNPSTAGAGQVVNPSPAALCFGRPVTLFVPAGGADFYGSSDPAVIDVILGPSGSGPLFRPD